MSEVSLSASNADNLYRHDYGGIYKVLFEALHSEDKSPLVIYEHIWPFEAGKWARPAEEFARKFTPISQAEVVALLTGDRSEAQAAVNAARQAARANRESK